MAVLRLILVLILVLLPLTVKASDTLKTVSEFGHTVFNNLNFRDTLNGEPRLDSIRAQYQVRLAVRTIGQRISKERTKSIVTASGTMGYQVDPNFVRIKGVTWRYNKYSSGIPVGDYAGLTGILSVAPSMGTGARTNPYQLCAFNKDSIYLSPIPDRVDTIMLTYLTRAVEVSAAADTVNLPPELYPAVEYFATAKAAGVIRDFEVSKWWIDLYVLEENLNSELFRSKREK